MNYCQLALLSTRTAINSHCHLLTQFVHYCVVTHMISLMSHHWPLVLIWPTLISINNYSFFKHQSTSWIIKHDKKYCHEQSPTIISHHQLFKPTLSIINHSPSRTIIIHQPSSSIVEHYLLPFNQVFALGGGGQDGCLGSALDENKDVDYGSLMLTVSVT